MSRLTLILGLIAAALLAVSALVGTAPVSLGDSLAALAGQGDAATRTILWEIRLPRAAAAFAVGAALGLAGAGLQGLLRVFSFLGLGAALIGLGYAYRRFGFDGK